MLLTFYIWCFRISLLSKLQIVCNLVAFGTQLTSLIQLKNVIWVCFLRFSRLSLQVGWNNVWIFRVTSLRLFSIERIKNEAVWETNLALGLGQRQQARSKNINCRQNRVGAILINFGLANIKIDVIFIFLFNIFDCWWGHSLTNKLKSFSPSCTSTLVMLWSI